MNRFIVAEPKKCIGCRTCEVACVLAHAGEAGVASLSPISFAPRLHVIKGMTVSTAVTCRHCEDAPCVNVCPSGAIIYSHNSVQVLQERCVGCKTCMVACPFGAMDVITVPVTKQFGGVSVKNGVKAQAHKCDLCDNNATGPACVAVCPTKALHVADRSTIDTTLRLRQERAAQESETTSLL